MGATQNRNMEIIRLDLTDRLRRRAPKSKDCTALLYEAAAFITADGHTLAALKREVENQKSANKTHHKAVLAAVAKQRVAENEAAQAKGRVADLAARLIATNPDKMPPYPEFCRHPDLCAGKNYCPRDPACCD